MEMHISNPVSKITVEMMLASRFLFPKYISLTNPITWTKPRHNPTEISVHLCLLKNPFQITTNDKLHKATIAEFMSIASALIVPKALGLIVFTETSLKSMDNAGALVCRKIILATIESASNKLNPIHKQSNHRPILDM